VLHRPIESADQSGHGSDLMIAADACSASTPKADIHTSGSARIANIP